MGQQLRQNLANGIAAAATAHDGGCRDGASIAPKPGLEHQLGPRGVECRCVGVEHADVHPAGAGGQRSAACQNGRASHIDGAAHHDHVAEAALVLGVAARLFKLPCRGRAAQPCARHLRGRHRGRAEVVEPDRASSVAALGREQTGLQAEQGQGVSRIRDCTAVANARVAIQPARQVDGQSQCSQGIDAVDGGSQVAFGRFRQAQAEQGIDSNIGMRRARHSAANRHTGFLGACAGQGRVYRLTGRISEQADPNLLARALQVHRRFEPIATVVAGAGGNPERLGVRRQRQRQLGGRQTGALHQSMGRQRRR